MYSKIVFTKNYIIFVGFQVLIVGIRDRSWTLKEQEAQEQIHSVSESPCLTRALPATSW